MMGLSLMNNLLEISKVENPSPALLLNNCFDLLSIFDQIVASFSHLLSYKPSPISLEYFQEDIAYFQHLFGEPSKYIRILSPFISYAINNNSDGSATIIKLILNNKAEDEHFQYVNFDIQIMGGWFSSEQSVEFIKFGDIGQSNSSFLDLSLSKSLLEIMGGQVTIDQTTGSFILNI